MTNPNDSVHPQVETETDHVFGHDASEATHVLSDFKFVGGLTKREYFAAMAMQGCLGNSALVQGISFTAKEQGHSVQQTIALVSLEHADALIEALNKETK